MQMPDSGNLSLLRSNFANLQNQHIGSIASKLFLPSKQGQWSKRVIACSVGGLPYSVLTLSIKNSLKNLLKLFYMKNIYFSIEKTCSKVAMSRTARFLS
jgi:hypothetical protein